MSVDWDQFAGGDGDYNDRFKFDNPGDELRGVITGARVIDNQYGKTPVLTIAKDDGVEVDVFISQAQLRSKLAEESPQVGDKVGIVFTGTEDRGGGKTLKLFDVAVKHATTTAAAPASGLSADDL